MCPNPILSSQNTLDFNINLKNKRRCISSEAHFDLAIVLASFSVILVKVHYHIMDPIMSSCDYMTVATLVASSALLPMVFILLKFRFALLLWTRW